MELPKSPFKLREIKIEVTHDCMLHCIHCSSITKPDSGRCMDWLSCNRILEEAKALGVKKVAFSGGEPLLWGHIKDAISQASKLEMEVFLYTTGNVHDAKKIMSSLQVAGLNKAMFSLFGGNAQQHEKITINKGSYEKTLDVVKYCSTIGLDTEFHFVPFSHNYQALREITLLASNVGVKCTSVLRLVPQGRGAKGKNGQLNHSQNLKLRKIIKDLCAQGHIIRLGSPYNFLMLYKKPQCRSGIDRITVGPDLRIFPCDAFKHISPKEIGQSPDFSNLWENSLKDCWEKSPYLGAVREYLLTDIAVECIKCEKLKDCLSGCMAQKFYVHGALQKTPDPMCLLGRQKMNLA